MGLSTTNAYVELQEELREIDELLRFKENDEDGDPSNVTTPRYRPTQTEQIVGCRVASGLFPHVVLGSVRTLIS